MASTFFNENPKRVVLQVMILGDGQMLVEVIKERDYTQTGGSDVRNN